MGDEINSPGLAPTSGFLFGTSELGTDTGAENEEWQFSLDSKVPAWPAHTNNVQQQSSAPTDIISDDVDETFWHLEQWTKWDLLGSNNPPEQPPKYLQFDPHLATIGTSQLPSPISQTSFDPLVSPCLSSPSHEDYFTFGTSYIATGTE